MILVLLCSPFWSAVDDDQQDQDGEEEQCWEGVHFWFDAFSDFAVYFGWKGINAWTFGKVCDYKIVKRHGKGKEETGKDTRKNIREDYFTEGVKVGGS